MTYLHHHWFRQSKTWVNIDASPKLIGAHEHILCKAPSHPDAFVPSDTP
jgi:hypothetical protein